MKHLDIATLMLYAKKNTPRTFAVVFLLKCQPSELIYCLQLLEIQFINVSFCHNYYTTQMNLIFFAYEYTLTFSVKWCIICESRVITCIQPTEWSIIDP